MKNLFTTKIGTVAIAAVAITLAVGTTIIPNTAQNAEAWAPQTSDMAWDWNECVKLDVPEKKTYYPALTMVKNADKASPNLQLESCDDVFTVSP